MASKKKRKCKYGRRVRGKCPVSKKHTKKRAAKRASKRVRRSTDTFHEAMKMFYFPGKNHPGDGTSIYACSPDDAVRRLRKYGPRFTKLRDLTAVREVPRGELPPAWRPYG